MVLSQLACYITSVLNVLVYDAVGAKGCIGCVKAMVKTRGTGMQQSGFCQVFNHLSWEKMFWMIFNRLAVRLQHVSSLSKGSAWDVEVSGLIWESLFSRVLSSFKYAIFLMLSVESLSWWSACVIWPSFSTTVNIIKQHQPYRVQMDL